MFDITQKLELFTRNNSRTRRETLKPFYKEMYQYQPDFDDRRKYRNEVAENALSKAAGLLKIFEESKQPLPVIEF
jgi:hypothetical protein